MTRFSRIVLTLLVAVAASLCFTTPARAQGDPDLPPWTQVTVQTQWTLTDDGLVLQLSQADIRNFDTGTEFVKAEEFYVGKWDQAAGCWTPALPEFGDADPYKMLVGGLSDPDFVQGIITTLRETNRDAAFGKTVGVLIDWTTDWDLDRPDGRLVTTQPPTQTPPATTTRLYLNHPDGRVFTDTEMRDLMNSAFIDDQLRAKWERGTLSQEETEKLFQILVDTLQLGDVEIKITIKIYGELDTKVAKVGMEVTGEVTMNGRQIGAGVRQSYRLTARLQEMVTDSLGQALGRSLDRWTQQVGRVLETLEQRYPLAAALLRTLIRR